MLYLIFPRPKRRDLQTRMRGCHKIGSKTTFSVDFACDQIDSFTDSKISIALAIVQYLEKYMLTDLLPSLLTASQHFL